MRPGAAGRRTLENAVAQPPGSAHRQHARVLGAGPGGLSLCLRRRGHRARRQNRHPQRGDRLQRPLVLPPHDRQRRAYRALRHRKVLRLVDHLVPVFRRRDEPRPGLHARILVHPPAGPARARPDRGRHVPVARRAALRLAVRGLRLLPPRNDGRPGEFQTDGHRGADPRKRQRQPRSGLHDGCRRTAALLRFPHAFVRRSALPRITPYAGPLADHGRHTRRLRTHTAALSQQSRHELLFKRQRGSAVSPRNRHRRDERDSPLLYRNTPEILGHVQLR